MQKRCVRGFQVVYKLKVVEKSQEQVGRVNLHHWQLLVNSEESDGSMGEIRRIPADLADLAD
jgi:hypothetical protein